MSTVETDFSALSSRLWSDVAKSQMRDRVRRIESRTRHTPTAETSAVPLAHEHSRMRESLVAAAALLGIFAVACALIGLFATKLLGSLGTVNLFDVLSAYRP